MTIVLLLLTTGLIIFWLFYLARKDKEAHKKILELRRQLEEEDAKARTAEREKLTDMYFNEPLVRIGIILLDGTTVYTAPFKHTAYGEKGRFSRDMANLVIQYLGDTIQDENGVYWRVSNIKGIFIETTDWYMGYGDDIRKKEE